MSRLILLSVFCCASLLSAKERALREEAFLKQELISFGSGDLPGGVEIGDFAMSPDGKKVVVAFDVGEGDKKLGVWLGEWEITGKKLVAKVKVAETSTPLRFAAIFHDRIRYTPDGSKILCQLDRSFHVFDASTLAPQYSVSIPELAGGSASEIFDRSFALSADSSRFSLFFGQSTYPSKTGFVRVYTTKTGNQLANWPLPVPIRSLSLSDNGNELLVTILHAKTTTDTLLLDSLTGQKIKSIESGFGNQRLGGAAVNAIFLQGDRFVSTAGGSMDAKGDYLGQSLKVFDSKTGKVTGEFKYEELNPSDDLWTSADGATVAILNLWIPHWRRRSIEGGAKHAELLFFNANQTEPSCVLGPLPEKSKERPKQSGFIRLSPDLRLIGLYMDRRVKIYQASECRVQ